MSSVTNDTVPIAESSITVDTPTNHRSIGLLSLIFGLVERSMASLRNLWTEETSLMSDSDLNFTIVSLFALVAIKAQGGFPFQTNPRTMRVSVNSLIMFALTSTAKHAFPVRRPTSTSVYAIVSRFGRMLSLVILNQGAKEDQVSSWFSSNQV